MKKPLILLTCIFTLISGTLLAHEGHGVMENGPAHYVFSIEHALPLIAVTIILIYILGKRVIRRA